MTMADFHLAVTTLLIFLFSNNTGNCSPKLQEVYVSLSGFDSDSCGSLGLPCRSIAQAVCQVAWGGIIFLNGTGTEDHPYDCKPHMTRDFYPGIYVNKSLILKSYYSVPNVSCIEGFHFQRATEEEQPLQIEISGISFQQTTMKFEDYSDVKIFNCSFRDSSTALAINIRKSTNLTLDIQGMSFFRNNTACIEITLFDNIKIKDRYVAVRVNDTNFLENGYNRGGPSEDGVIKLTTHVAKPASRMHLFIFCCKVKCIANRGSFIINNITTAVTREIYKNVQLKYNKGTSTRASQADGLYYSRAMNVRATFLNVLCLKNTRLRCIVVISHDVEIEIETSKLTGQSINTNGGCLSLEVYGQLSLGIFNTTFSRNKAKTGGAIYINCPNGIVNLNFTDVNFSRCSSEKYGCAVSVGRSKQQRQRLSPYKLSANFRNVKVMQCSGLVSSDKCRSVCILLQSGNLRIDRSTWSENLQNTSGALFMVAGGGKVDVEISDSIFMDNGATKRNGAVVSLLALKNHSGNVDIVNTSFINRKKRQSTAMQISAKYHIKLFNVTASRYWVGLEVQLVEPKDVVNICVDNCKFVENIKDIYINVRESNRIQLIVKNTIFVSALTTESGYAIRIVIPHMRTVTFSKVSINLDNNTFDSKPSSGIALFFKGEKNVTITNSTFRNCVCFHQKQWKKDPSKAEFFRETATGAISILTNPDTPLQFGCVESDAANDTHPLWSYDSHVLFEDTNFIDNSGLMAGGVYIGNGNATFKGCTFQDNFGSQRAGHVYSAYGTGQVNFVNCSFTNQKEERTMNKIRFDKASFLYSESEGPVYFQNTTMVLKVVGTEMYTFSVLEISNGGFVNIDDNTSIQCNTGQRLKLENNTHFVYSERNKSDCRINITVLRYSCTLCAPGLYTLQKGVSHGALVGPSFECLSCPFGANCVRTHIAAKANFWGHQISKKPPSLKFFACPEHYCQSPPSYSAQYNSCYGNRTGVLCGECLPGYSETLFSTECRKITECNNFWMWVLTMLLLTTGFVLYLLIKPPVLSFLGTHIFWFRKRDMEHISQELGQIEEHSENGYLKITFYFYQAAELLLVGSAENLLHKIPFLYAVVAAFNFEVRSITDGIGCPFPGITAVIKELLLSATVLIAIAEVAILFFVHFVLNIIRRKKRPSLLHYMAVALEILLLAYERLAETSLKLMHCVPIGSEKRLFFNGEIICWQWWQYIVLAYVGIFIVPFVIVLYFGSSKLYKACISSKEFLGACILPLPFLMYWLLKKMLKRKDNIHEDSDNNKDVLEVLHGPFRQPNGNDKGTLYWESVLIGRRLILLCCHAFIATSMFRMVCMAGACVIMLLHHIWKNPYRDPIANKAESFSLLTLVMMAVINLTKATLISFGTTPDGLAKSYLETLEWAEVGAFAFVPTLLCIFLMFASFSQLVRLTLTLTKLISRCVQLHSLSLGFTNEMQRPLLDTSVEE